MVLSCFFVQLSSCSATFICTDHIVLLRSSGFLILCNCRFTPPRSCVTKASPVRHLVHLSSCRFVAWLLCHLDSLRFCGLLNLLFFSIITPWRANIMRFSVHALARQPCCENMYARYYGQACYLFYIFLLTYSEIITLSRYHTVITKLRSVVDGPSDPSTDFIY